MHRICLQSPLDCLQLHLVVRTLYLCVFIVIVAVNSLSIYAQEVSPERRIAELESHVAKLESRLQSLDQQFNKKELDERWTREIRSLIDDVLEDASTRNQIDGGGIYAGNQGGQFFLQSADSKYRLYINAFMQNWFAINQMNGRPAGPPPSDSTDVFTGGPTQLGFETRRARIWWHGNVVDERIGFRLQLEVSPPDLGRTFIQEAYASYFINDDFKMMFGLMKLPFLRTQLASAAELLSVDRTATSYFFNLNRQVQLQMQWFGSENVRLYAALSNGTRRDLSLIPPRGYYTIGNDPATLSITARADWRLFGTWLLQYKNVAWPGTEDTAILGAAINYQIANQDITDNFSIFPGNGDYLSFTVDGAWHFDNWFLAGMGYGAFIRHASQEIQDRDLFGAQLEAAYLHEGKYQPFLRFEWMHPDVEGAGDPVAMNTGVNVYFSRQNVKWTSDIVWFFTGDAFNSLEINPFTEPVFIPLYGLGTTGSFSENNMFVFRTQLQLQF
ncbi:hypothetical protein JD969_13145 [Planctomycetota bacterium]|nr:hypothetical protein JD969_13145 [Planctomycetota bacterium]